MNLKLLNHETYKQLFRVKGEVLAINGEYLVKGSLSLAEPLIVFQDNVMQSLIKRDLEIRCLEKGLEIFGSKKLYKEYSEGFRQYIKMAFKELVPKYKNIPRSIDLKEWEDLLKVFLPFWDFYGKTEFSYHDLAN